MWLVPSAGKAGAYTVNLALPSCTCVDFERSGGKCKHIWAAEIARNNESHEQRNS
jgi:predicted nucleic acid-binding Zn finger protein